MRRTRILAALMIAATSATLGLFEREAEACGGCFAPPENPTIVTDHRMILSISREQSTLYDQIRYQGEPQAFAWVLPIVGTVEIGLSADVVFSALDQTTQTQILAPPLNCPPRPNDCFRDDFAASEGAPSADAGAGSVTVTKREVVGPYDTVQLKSDDAGALNAWLADNGFAVPDEIKPVIGRYVTEHFDFLALKLVPGKDVSDMRPVRVTTQGASAVLPLRMVAAGTGANVGISLWVLGEGRYEPQNFPSFTIAAEELAWDWTQNRSNYVDLRADKSRATGGRGWEVESSTILYPQTIESIVRSGTWNGEGPFPQTDEERAAQDYLPVENEQGVIIKTAAEVRNEDLATLFHGIATASARVTRMRADLVQAALDADLAMTASANQTVLPTVRQVTKELNEPQCPVWNGCEQVGTAPRDEAFARSTTGGGSACATSPHKEPAWLAAGIGFAGLAVVHAARRRRRRS
jgi:hypothetical protein